MTARLAEGKKQIKTRKIQIPGAPTERDLGSEWEERLLHADSLFSLDLKPPCSLTGQRVSHRTSRRPHEDMKQENGDNHHQTSFIQEPKSNQASMNIRLQTSTAAVSDLDSCLTGSRSLEQSGLVPAPMSRPVLGGVPSLIMKAGAYMPAQWLHAIAPSDRTDRLISGAVSPSARERLPPPVCPDTPEKFRPPNT